MRFLHRPPAWAVALGCIGIALLLYTPVAALNLLSDDLVVMQRAGVERDLDQGGFFRPLSDLTILLWHALFGTSALAHRMVNILVHGLCAFLLHQLLRRMAPERPAAARIAALLFLVYPYHGEALIWIVGRGSSMATLFTLLGLLVLLAEPRTWRAATLSSTCWVLGLLSYESALLYPLLALPLLLRRGQGLRAAWPLPAVWVVVFLAYLGLRLGHSGGLVNDYVTTFLRHGPMAYLDSLMHGAGRLFLPPGPWHAPRYLLLLAAAITAGVVLLLRTLRRDRASAAPWAMLGWMLLLSLLAPMLVGVSTETSEGDRFLYMPSAFLCAVLALSITQLGSAPLRTAVVLLMMTVQLTLLLQVQANWRVASGTLDRFVDDLRALQAPGHTWVVHVPEEHEGAFILRHGLREALELRGMEAGRITHAGRLRRYSLVQAPDTIRPLITTTGIMLEPGVHLKHQPEGTRLVTPFHDVLLAPNDRVLYWDRHALRVLWPQPVAR
jgi:hypothetical protein